MMRLPPFRWISARSAREAARALSDHGPEAAPVAGGTDLFPNMKRGQAEPRVLVGLRSIPGLTGVSGASGTESGNGSGTGGLRIGSLATLDRVASDPAVVARAPALASACGQVSTPVLRRMGTIGGNLLIDTRCTYYNQTREWRESIDFCIKKDGAVCWVAPGSPKCWAVSSSDSAPALIALGASVVLVGPDGERELPVESLYRSNGVSWLRKAPDEVLTEVRVPPGDGWRSSFRKLRRRDVIDFAIVGVAASVRTDPTGVVEDVRIALSAVDPAPLRAVEAESFLRGARLDRETVAEAARLAAGPARPLDNTDLTLHYRKRMVEAYVRRALEDLLPGAGPNQSAPPATGSGASPR